MNANQLWDKLIHEGYIPISNKIELKNSIKVKVNESNFDIVGIYKKDSGEVALIKAAPKFYGRLAN